MSVDTAPPPSGATTQTADVLRVLAGANAGAEVPLTQGAWLIGSSEDADLTFSEPALAPRHLRLLASPAGVQVEALADGARIGTAPLALGESRALPRQAALVLGATVFAVGPSGGPWPDPALAMVPPAPVPERPPEPEPASKPAAPAPVAPAVRRVRRRWPYVAALLILAVGVSAGFAAWTLWPVPPPNTPAAAPVDAAAAARAVIHGMGLDEWVFVTGTGPRPVLSGQVRTDAQAGQLAAGLRRAGVDAQFTVLTDAALLDAVRTVLTAYGIEARPAVASPGEVTLTGFAPDTARVDGAVRRLRADVPGLRAVADRIDTPERARLGLDAALRGAGLAGSVRLAAAPSGVVASGSLSPAGMASWTELSAAFRAEHGDRVRLLSQITAVASAAPRGLVLGKNPALVMDDGRHLRIGDALDAAGRIVAIDERRVRVRTASGELDVPYSRRPSWIMEEKNER